MLTSIHFLLTYACNFECDHCFLFSGPGAGGTFGVVQLRTALEEAAQVGTIDSVFFEGGEPMLYFPVLVEALRTAKRLGFTTGIVTNGYWATWRRTLGSGCSRCRRRAWTPSRSAMIPCTMETPPVPTLQGSRSPPRH